MNTLEIPVDQYQRYRMAAEIVNAVRGERRALKILEVGGYPPQLDAFLPDDEIMITDIVSATEIPVGHGSYAKADALNLHFDDKSFDIIISLDVLEHIEPAHREKFVTEQIRIAGDYIVLAAPFNDGKGVVSREELLLFEFIEETHGYNHKYFEEHLKYGLPEIENIGKIFRSQDWEIQILPNGCFYNWFLVILLEYTAEFNAPLKNILPKLREYYNHYFYERDNREPAYRHFIIASRNGFSEDEKAGLMKLISTETQGEWPPMEYAASLTELARLESQIRLEDKIKGLEHDLAARNEQIEHLRQYTKELEQFAGKIKGTFPWRIYETLFKK